MAAVCFSAACSWEGAHLCIRGSHSNRGTRHGGLHGSRMDGAASSGGMATQWMGAASRGVARQQQGQDECMWQHEERKAQGDAWQTAGQGLQQNKAYRQGTNSPKSSLDQPLTPLTPPHEYKLQTGVNAFISMTRMPTHRPRQDNGIMRHVLTSMCEEQALAQAPRVPSPPSASSHGSKNQSSIASHGRDDFDCRTLCVKEGRCGYMHACSAQ